MDRSITPRISQLPQGRKDAPSSEAGGGVELSKSVASAGLLSWMRAALQLGPAGQTSTQQGQATDTCNHQHLTSILDSSPLQRQTSLDSSLSTSRRTRSSLSRDSTYQEDEKEEEEEEESEEDQSGDEETFAPFAPAPTSSMPPLVRPTARRDAAFVRESSDGSLGEGQVLLDGAPAPLPALRLSFGAANVTPDSLKVHEARQDGQFVRDTIASAPSLVLTPPDEKALEHQTSPISGWVEEDRFEPTPTPGGRRISIASTSSNLTEPSPAATATATAISRQEQDVMGDGETLEEFTLGQRPRSPAEMQKGRQSREKVVLGTRGANLREQADQQEARMAKREKRRAEKEHIKQQQQESNQPSLTADDWDESRSKTPKAFTPVIMASTPRTTTASTTPDTTSTPPLNDPSPRRPRLSFFGRKREPSISSLLAPGIAVSPEHSRPSSGAASANEDGQEEENAERTNKGGLGSEPFLATGGGGGVSNETAQSAKPQSVSAGFWRLGRSSSVNKRRGGNQRPSTASSSSLSSSYANAQRAENLNVTGTTSSLTSRSFNLDAATASRRNSLAATDDAVSIRSTTSRSNTGRPRPLSNAGSMDGIASLKSARLKATSTRKEKVRLPLEAPKAQKVRAKSKPAKARDFGRLFLVQELVLGVNPPSPATALGEVRRDSLPRRSGESFGPRDVAKPPLLHSDSTSSITSAASTATSSTAAPPSTSGSTSTKAATGTGYAKRRATWAMKFSVDGKYLAVAGQDAVVRVYQVLDSAVARAKEVTMARARFEAALSAANGEGLFPASGGRAGGSSSSLGSHVGSTSTASVSAPNSVRGKLHNTNSTATSPLPNLSVFASEPVREFRGHTNDVLDLSWSKGGFLLSASMDKTARLWHLSSPNSLVSFVHGDFVTSACFHPRDDRFMLTGSLDGKLRLWNIPGKRVQYSQEIPGLITACSFTQSGATACVGTFAGAALFYTTDGLTYSSSIAVRSPSGKNAKGGRKITGIEPLASDGAAGERVLITSNDSRIRAYNLRDKSMSARWKAGKTYINRTSQIRASVADDGTYVVSGSECGNEGGLVHVWDVGQQAGDARSPSAAFKAGKAGLTQADSVCEYWTAAAGTITCAIMAPLKTNALLRDADDPILMHAAMRNAGRVSSSTTQALSAMSLASAFSAAVPNSLKSGTSASDISPGFHPRECRIIASVDESAVVRIWRQDTHGAIP